MTNPSQAEIMQQWVKLTEAITALADRDPATRTTSSGPVPALGGGPTEAELIRQRVDFGYRALGALTGRVGDRAGDFVVPLVEARRFGELLLFRGLAAEADWVEVRRDRKVELRRIHRFRRWDIADEPEYRDTLDRCERFDGGDPEREADSRAQRGWGFGAVRLRDFAPGEPIGALLFLGTRLGPVVALGPRLGPAAEFF
jgi:hypothetical protein